MCQKPITSFPKELHERLNYYVYRLIDPRDGMTFYVGKGQGNRIFDHLANARKEHVSKEVRLSDKIQKIQAITNEGLEPIHIIHRHGMTEVEAFEVEAALIDVFPGLVNIQGGHGSDEYGPANVSQLIQKYACEEMRFEPQDELLIIKVGKTIDNMTLYEAIRFAWAIKINRARNAKYVLAIVDGICKGVFQPHQWMPATTEYFPTRTESLPERCGFEGVDAPDEVKTRFINKRIPMDFVKRGQSNPCAYVHI